MIWWIPAAFLASFSRATSRLSNQYFQLPGVYIVLWTKVFITIIMLPLVCFVPWPNEPLFYILLLLQAPFAVYKDKKTFDLTAQYGSGAVTRIEPLSTVVLFFAWLLVTPDLLSINLENPLRFAGITLAILMTAFFALRLR